MSLSAGRLSDGSVTREEMWAIMLQWGKARIVQTMFGEFDHFNVSKSELVDILYFGLKPYIRSGDCWIEDLENINRNGDLVILSAFIESLEDEEFIDTMVALDEAFLEMRDERNRHILF